MKVLVCDDDERFAEMLRQKLIEQIAAVDHRVKVDCISDPAAITEQELARYDMAFLDINMGPEAMDGIQLAQKLRAVQQDTVLIFVTDFVEYSLQGYEVQAFRYLLKSELDEKLGQYVQQALSVWARKRTMIRVSYEGEEMDISPNVLAYVETDQRRLILHLHNADRDTLYARATMAELAEQLAERGFLRVHKSYLVNMAFIEKLQSNMAVLNDGTELPVSTHYYGDIKKIYIQWKGKKRWSIG